MSPQLSDLYDADRALADEALLDLRSRVDIPHPLFEIEYGDGKISDTTAGRVHSRLARQLQAIRAEHCEHDWSEPTKLSNDVTQYECLNAGCVVIQRRASSGLVVERRSR